MAIFWHFWPKSAKIRNFIKNQAVLFFYPYCPPTSCQVSEKLLERFPRSIRYARTNERTDAKVISQNQSLSLVQKNFRRRTYRLSELTGTSKIDNLDCAPLRVAQQHVLWLQIAMYHLISGGGCIRW